MDISAKLTMLQNQQLFIQIDKKGNTLSTLPPLYPLYT